MERGVRWSAVATALVVAVAGTAACGSSRGAGAGAGADCVESGVESDAVKVGLLYSDTGPLAGTFGPARSGVEARANLANESGGVNGRKIIIEWSDDQSTRSANLIAAEELVKNDGVFGMVEATAAASGSADYLESSGIPATGLAAEAIWSDHRNMFTVSSRPVDGPSITTFGAYVKRQGGTRAFLLQGAASPVYQSIGARFRASMEAAGIPVVGQEEYTDSVTSVAALMGKIKASNADVIAGATSSPGLATVLRAVKDAGVQMKVVFGPDGYNPSLVTQFGSGIAGMSTYSTVVPFELNSPAVRQYRDAMARYAPELSDVSRSTAIYGYIVMDLFIRGLEEAGKCPSRARFISGLRTVTGYNADGLLAGNADFRPESSAGITCYYFLRVNAQGTGFEVVDGGDGPDGHEWCGTELPR
jgi:ABC-type branched-subunit amino acid transport system substrate-binding protein